MGCEVILDRRLDAYALGIDKFTVGTLRLASAIVQRRIRRLWAARIIVSETAISLTPVRALSFQMSSGLIDQ
jgi:hypothetical protein